MKKTLVFYKGRAPKGEKTNWVMHEYRLEGNFSYHQFPRASKEEWVVCRIFHKSAGAKKPTSGFFNSNMYVDDCLGSPSLPPLLESPSYKTIHNDEAELSDIANIHLHNGSCSSNIIPNDPQFNVNMKPPNPNAMSYILSQLSSSASTDAMSFQALSSQVGLPSNSILRALVEQYSSNDLSLKQCKMEPPSSSFGANENDAMICREGGQWNMDGTQQQMSNNMPNNGIIHNNHAKPHDHIAPSLNPDHMNSEMFSRVSRSYQVDPSAASPAVDLDSLWAY